MKCDHGRWPFSMVRLDGLTSMVWFLHKSIYKAFGPLTRCKLNVDQEEWPCTKKWMCWFFFIYALNGQFWKEFFFSSLTILLCSLLFASCFRMFSPWISTRMFTIEKRRRNIYFALKVIHVFVHAFEVCCGHSYIDFTRIMEEVYNFELGFMRVEGGAYGVKNGCTDL